jgi:hypothetical protein
MDRQVKKPGKITYEERLRIGAAFYSRLLKVFLITVLVCGCGLGYLWFWLARYESRSANGAMTDYMKLVAAQEWDKIYDEDIQYFAELNSREAYTAYLASTYNDSYVKDATFTKSGMDATGSVFYDVDMYSYKIAELELKKPDGSNSWKVRTISNDTSYDFDLLDPSIAFSINDVAINGNYDSTDGNAIAAFSELGLGTLPTTTRYSITGLISAPNVSVTDADKYEAVRIAQGTQYLIGAKPTDDQYAEMSQAIQDAAFAYCKYITKDGTFYALTQLLYPGTTFYTQMTGFDNQWFSSHNSIDFQNIQVYDVLPVGDSAFIGSISFDYIIKASDLTQTKSVYYQTYFIKNKAGKWKMTNLVLNNPS